MSYNNHSRASSPSPSFYSATTVPIDGRSSSSGAASLHARSNSSSDESLVARFRSTSISPNSSRFSSQRPSPPPLQIAKNDLAYRQQTFIKRPERTIQDSKLGTKITVEANYFKMFCQNMRLHHYDIQYMNDKKQPMRKREETRNIFWHLYQQQKNRFPELQDSIFNDINLFYSKSQIRFDGGRGQQTFYVNIESGRRPSRYTIEIRYVGLVDIAAQPKTIQETTQLVSILDSLLSMQIRCPLLDVSRDFISNKRSIFYNGGRNQRSIPIDHGLEVLTGLHTAVKADSQAGILLNVDLGFKVFHKQMFNLIHYYCEIVKNLPFNQIDAQFLQELRNGRIAIDKKNLFVLSKKLSGFKIKVKYGKREKVMKFTKFSEKSAQALTFDMNGRRISVADYFEQQLGIQIDGISMPCVSVGRGWVPMELCFACPEPEQFKGQIPERQLRTMVRETAYPPMQRKQIIQEMTNGTQMDPSYISDNDQFLRNFNVNIDKNFVSLKATLLPPPKLEYGNNSIEDKNHEGAWELAAPTIQGDFRKVRNHEQPTKVIPGIVFVGNGGNAAPFQFLTRCLQKFGVNLPLNDQVFYHSVFNPERQNWKQFEEEMRTFKAEALKRFPDAIPFILIVLPYRCTTRRQRNAEYASEYATIKYITDVVVGVNCQCILQQTYAKLNGNEMTCATGHNMVIKILAKLGIDHYSLEREGNHRNWTKLTDPTEPTLLIGIDVTHPGEMDRRQGGVAALSVASVVGNIDVDCMKFEASNRVQVLGEERTVNLEKEFMDRINAFANNNNDKLPAHIVVYRDGIGETMFDQFLHEEKQSIVNACRVIHHEYRPTITYIVVSKRHHTRFFPTRKEDTEKGDNLKAGCLVENEVTSTNYFDFYLLSHYGPLGTSRPTHYYVLWDEWAPSHAFWQTITHALTYSFVRCPRSISQPAPTMYAHLAAKRAKDYITALFGYDAGEMKGLNDYETYIEIKRRTAKFDGMSGMPFV